MNNDKNIKEPLKEFDAVKFMRDQRDKINDDISNMTPDEIIRYFKDNLPKERVKPSA